MAWLVKLCCAVDITEAFKLNYTNVRPAWLNDDDEVD